MQLDFYWKVWNLIDRLYNQDLIDHIGRRDLIRHLTLLRAGWREDEHFCLRQLVKNLSGDIRTAFEVQFGQFAP